MDFLFCFSWFFKYVSGLLYSKNQNQRSTAQGPLAEFSARFFRQNRIDPAEFSTYSSKSPSANPTKSTQPRINQTKHSVTKLRINPTISQCTLRCRYLNFKITQKNCFGNENYMQIHTLLKL